MDSYEHEGAQGPGGRRPDAPPGTRPDLPPDTAPAPPGDRTGSAVDQPERADGAAGAESGAEPGAESGTDAAGGVTASSAEQGAPVSPAAKAGRAPEPEGEAAEAPVSGIAALSLPYQITAAVVLGLVALVAGVHLLFVFLHVAPSNTASKQYDKGIDAWVYPEFEQNWKLFAPNPLQQNIRIQVKAELSTADGGKKTTEWIDLSAGDAAEIRGNLLPSHTLQNLLRRSWDFYTSWHDNQNRSTGPRGELAQTYLKRIVMLKLDQRHGLGAEVERIQVRSETELVKPPSWSKEKNDSRPVYRVLPWWNVTPADRPLGTGIRAAGPVGLQSGTGLQSGAGSRSGAEDGVRNGERTEAAR
ncbi:DUF5819 family protein [Streptomyces tsukubensis]|uniref:DUF5819 family protein n=1 Tax=Streptomyces tsukubensis TaxID=83656 RepID=UPI00344DEEFF